MKLIKMTEFVHDIVKSKKSEYKDYCPNDSDIALNKIESYCELLRKPLNLGMFVHCNEKGEVLEEPLNDDFYYWEWKEAESRILFEFNVIFKLWEKEDVENSTVEDLLTDDVDYFLKENAF